jgi:hypothetical protein
MSEAETIVFLRLKIPTQDFMAKKMVMPFFDQQGAIFTNCVLLAITGNAAYIVMGIFMKRLKQKRVVAEAAGQLVLRWNNAPVHIAAFLCKWPAKHNIQVLYHHRYSPNIAYAGFVLYPKVKNHLNDITLTQDTLKSTWERAIRTLNTKEFATAYRR